MRRLALGTTIVGLVALVACDVPLAPKWNVDLFFPVDYPPVVLSDYAVGGQIPPGSVSFTTPYTTQNVQGATGQVLSEDLQAMSAEIILTNTLQVSGRLVVSIATTPGNLFSTTPGLALTDTITVPAAGTDTSHVAADLNLFRNAQTLYFQTKGTVASTSPSGTTVGPNDQVKIGINLFATVRLSK